MEGAPAVDRGRQGGASLVSEASLARLAEIAGEDALDPRRFRMLIEVDGLAPHEEDGWVGRTFRIGDAAVRFRGHVGRCLITSRDPDTGVVDLPTLDLLGEYRREVTIDRAAAVRDLRRGRPAGQGPRRRSGRRRLTQSRGGSLPLEMSEDRVRIDIADHVAVVTLTRPEKHNALDLGMFEGIVGAATRLRREPGVRAVVVHGEGPSFCSGLDIAGHDGRPGRGRSHGPAEGRPAELVSASGI